MGKKEDEGGESGDMTATNLVSQYPAELECFTCDCCVILKNLENHVL